MFFSLSRQHPFVLPHEIIPYLMEKQLFRSPSPRQIKRYWRHVRAGSKDLGNMSPDDSHVPLWLWCDEAQCNEQTSVLVVAMGSILDDKKYSLDFCYPLTFCSVESYFIWQQFDFPKIYI